MVGFVKDHGHNSFNCNEDREPGNEECDTEYVYEECYNSEVEEIGKVDAGEGMNNGDGAETG